MATATLQKGLIVANYGRHFLVETPDGKRLIVSREHVRAWLEGRPVLARAGLNIAAIR